MKKHKQPHTTSRFSRLKLWFRAHARIRFLLITLIVVALATGAWWLFGRPDASSSSQLQLTSDRHTPPPVYYAPLTGTIVADEAATKKPTTAIMLENSPDSRPQSGLAKSEIVYEAIAEGGITRFLAIYQQEKPALVGPVRSLRMYYVDWLAPYDASVAHVGGSARSLSEIRNGSYRDIDQFFNAGTYWRASDRYAPHNVYTSFERIDALNAQKGFTSSEPKVFARQSSEPAESPSATNIAVTMSGPLYNSSYAYDRASNTYARSQAGVPHTDRESGRIAPSVVIVIESPMRMVMEDGYREQYQTTGSGKATIFQDGTAQEVTWHKSDRASQLRFTDKNNQEVSLSRGQTWISVVPAGTGGVSWR